GDDYAGVHLEARTAPSLGPGAELCLATAAEAHGFFAGLLIHGLATAQGLTQAKRLLAATGIREEGQELTGREAGVTVFDNGGRRAVFELKVGDVVAGRAAEGHPVAHLAPDALHHSAAEEANDIKLVRTLAEGHPATLRQIELRGHPGPEEPVVVR